jgi:hypothetical protein
MTLLMIQSTVGFQYKMDTGDDCSESTATDCQQSPSLWFSCPMTCSERLQVEGSMAEVREDPQAFFELTVQPFQTGKSSVSLEDYEGYVTVFAVVPKAFSGMTKFYRDMLEHIAFVYPFTVQFLLLPWNGDDDESSTMSSTVSSSSLSSLEEEALGLTRYTKPRVTVLESAHHQQPTAALNYLLHAELMAGNSRSSLWDDRVTVFVVSCDGMFIERLISPTITQLERRIAVHLLQLEIHSEL